MPPAGATTRFVADAMLGSLARKLRALGFDTAYYKSGNDSGILRLAVNEGRTILTSDRQLGAYATSRGSSVILLTGKNDAERVHAIARAALESGMRLVRGDPLCSLCGGELVGMGRKEVVGRVPPSVERRHRLFWSCRSCGQIYWRGSHWKKLRSLSKRLGEK